MIIKIIFYWFLILFSSCDKEGLDITDVSYFEQDGQTVAAILSSSASVVSYYYLTKEWLLGKKLSSVLIYSGSGAAYPNSIIANQNLSIISLGGTNELALVIKNKEVIFQKLLDKAQTPDALAFVTNNSFLVSYTNYYRYATKDVEADVRPGLIALVDVQDKKLDLKDTFPLPFKNPTFIARDENNTFWVLCSGVWSFKDSIFVSHGAGLVNLSLKNNKIEKIQEIDLKDFSPAAPAILDKYIVVPQSWGNKVLVINKKDGKIGQTFTAENKEWEFTFAKKWQNDMVLLGETNNGIVSFSTNGKFFPPPFDKPIKFLDYNNLSPKTVILRNEKDYLGFDAHLILTVQNKIIPFNLPKVSRPS